MDKIEKAPANDYPHNLAAALTSLTEEELKRIKTESKHLFKEFEAKLRDRDKPRLEFISRGGGGDRWTIPPLLFESSNRTSVEEEEEEERRRCDLCKDKLVTRRVLDEVSVMACGHVYHSTCFMTLVASSSPIPDSRDPPCFLCRQG